MLLKVLVVLIALCSYGCANSSLEEQINQLEGKLESFMNKKVRDVVNEFGTPNKYINKTESGTYMVYDYRPKNYDCVIMFKFEAKTLKIIDWDYEGNCWLINRHRIINF